MSGSRAAKLRSEWMKRKPLVWTAYRVARRDGLSFRAFKREYKRRKSNGE